MIRNEVRALIGHERESRYASANRLLTSSYVRVSQCSCRMRGSGSTDGLAHRVIIYFSRDNTSFSLIIHWPRHGQVSRSSNGWIAENTLGFFRNKLGVVRGAIYCHGSQGYQAFAWVGEGRTADRSVDASVCSACVVACYPNRFRAKMFFFRRGEASIPPGEKSGQ